MEKLYSTHISNCDSGETLQNTTYTFTFELCVNHFCACVLYFCIYLFFLSLSRNKLIIMGSSQWLSQADAESGYVKCKWQKRDKQQRSRSSRETRVNLLWGAVRTAAPLCPAWCTLNCTFIIFSFFSTCTGLPPFLPRTICCFELKLLPAAFYRLSLWKNAFVLPDYYFFYFVSFYFYIVLPDITRD